MTENTVAPRSAVDPLMRCGRRRADGATCRTPVARLGGACSWHRGQR